MPKWEYCIITGLAADSLGFSTNYPKMQVFTAKGVELKTDFQQRQRGVSEVNMVGATIALLGVDGWELVGSAEADDTPSSGKIHVLYFKRLVKP